MHHTASSDFFFALLIDGSFIPVESQSESSRLTCPFNDDTYEAEVITEIGLLGVDRRQESRCRLILFTESKQPYAVDIHINELLIMNRSDIYNERIDTEYRHHLKYLKQLRKERKQIAEPTLFNEIGCQIEKVNQLLEKDIEIHEEKRLYWMNRLERIAQSIEDLTGQKIETISGIDCIYQIHRMIGKRDDLSLKYVSMLVLEDRVI